MKDLPVKFVASAAWTRAYEEKERAAKEEELRRKMEADKAAAAGLEPAPSVVRFLLSLSVFSDTWSTQLTDSRNWTD